MAASPIAVTVQYPGFEHQKWIHELTLEPGFDIVPLLSDWCYAVDTLTERAKTALFGSACYYLQPYSEVLSGHFDLEVEPYCPGVAEFDSTAADREADSRAVELGDNNAVRAAAP